MIYFLWGNVSENENVRAAPGQMQETNLIKAHSFNLGGQEIEQTLK